MDVNLNIILNIVLGALNPIIDDGVDEVAGKAGDELHQIVKSTVTELDDTAVEKLFRFTRAVENAYRNPPLADAVTETTGTAA